MSSLRQTDDPPLTVRETRRIGRLRSLFREQRDRTLNDRRWLDSGKANCLGGEYVPDHAGTLYNVEDFDFDFGGCERHSARSESTVRGQPLALVSPDVPDIKSPRRRNESLFEEYLAETGGSHAEQGGSRCIMAELKTCLKVEPTCSVHFR